MNIRYYQWYQITIEETVDRSWYSFKLYRLHHMLWFLFVGIEVSEWLNHACQAYVDNNSSLSSSDSLLRRPGRSLGNTKITHGGKSPSKSILNKWPHNASLKVHVKSQRKPCLCQRVSVCPWGILTACLMPWTSRGISISIASGVCVVFAIYGWSIYRPWFGALAELRRTARKNCAELWGNFVSEETLSPKRRNVKKDNWWVPAIEYIQDVQGSKKRLDPSWSVHLTGGLHANMQLR